MLTTIGIEARKSKRVQKALSTVVKGRESQDEHWKEVTVIKSVSRTGAGFTLERQCQVGQLLSLMIPLPNNLRCYDEEKELYRVWGLIQHCSPISDENGSVYHVGVAFIGKHAPESYRSNPQQSYKICGMNDEGLWKIAEAERPFVHRKYPRYWASIEVSLSIYEMDTPEEIVEDEEIEFVPETTTTENISLSGALVFSNLDVNIGDCINFACNQHNFTSIAIVRNRTWDGKTMPKLHLEFISQQFPIQKISTPVEDSKEN